MKTILTSFLLVAVVLAGVILFVTHTAPTPIEPTTGLQTTKIQRGNLSRTLSATGTVKLEQVEVGAQVTGMIASFGADSAAASKPLDCGSRVRKGMVLAQIDQTIYKAQVDCAEAALLKSKANLMQSEFKREQTGQEWKRAEGLQPVKAIAESEYDLALANFHMASANVSLWEAAVQESEASLRIAKTNLDHTIIKSPCDGVIIDRRVNIGQTVVAAFNAPGLFLIAKDSQQVQVWASIDEANIGYIRPGLPVRFTVNAYLDAFLKGEVTLIRLNPTRQDDTTNYTVVVTADHSDALLPEMTANLQFEVERHPNVLLIPNNALQWPPAWADAADRQVDGIALSPGDESYADASVTLEKDQNKNHCLWIKDGDLVHPVEVKIGATDGLMTEVTGNNVKEGMEVVWGKFCMKDER